MRVGRQPAAALVTRDPPFQPFQPRIYHRKRQNIARLAQRAMGPRIGGQLPTAGGWLLSGLHASPHPELTLMYPGLHFSAPHGRTRSATGSNGGS